MALYAAPSGPSEAARYGIVQWVSSGQDTRTATDPCLVCGRPATWRIERPDGSYLVCDWCALIIREYDARHPERDPSRHVRLAWDDGLPRAPGMGSRAN
jgi:hypothetical protein